MVAAAGKRPAGGGSDSRIEKIIGRVGSATFGFYRFMATFGREPIDPEDFFDGIETANALQEIEGLKWQKV